MHKYMSLTLITAIVLLLSSCTFSKIEDAPEQPQPVQEPSASVTPAEDEEIDDSYVPVPGGVIKIDCRNPKTFNPILNEDLSVDRLLRLIYEPLVAIDKSVKPVPALASAWEFSPDGASITVHIRESAKWEDGSEITANDVKYTLDAILASPETSLYNKCMENILDYSATDRKTLKINYVKPFADALYNLTFPVVPSGHFDGAAADELILPLASGLYKLDEFNTMRNVKLSSNGQSYRQAANIPEIEAVVVRDLDSSLYAYEQRLLDMVGTSLTNWKQISTTRQSNIFKSASSGYEFLALNFRTPALRDINIRKAIAHSLPKTEIIDKIYAGNAFETDTPLNPQSWLYEPDTQKYEYDLESAKQCLRISAYSIPDGEALRLLVNSDNAERMQTAELLQSSLTEIGIPCTIEEQSFGDYSLSIMTGNFDIAVCGLHMPLRPDFAAYLGNIGDVLGENNFVSYKDDVLDGYLAQAEMSVFEAAQASAYSNIQKRIAEDLPYISILYKADIVLTGKNVYGEVTSVINNAYNNIGELYIRN